MKLSLPRIQVDNLLRRLPQLVSIPWVKLLFIFFGALAFFYLLSLPNRTAQQQIRIEPHRIQQRRDELVKTYSLLTSTPSPNELQPAKNERFKIYTSQLRTLQGSLPPATDFQKPRPTKVIIPRWLPPDADSAIENSNRIISADSTQQAYPQSYQALTQAHEIIGRQTEAMQVLAKFMDYSSRQDFRVFEPGSANTEERIKRTLSGFKHIQDSMTKLDSSTKDPIFKDIVSQLKILNEQSPKLLSSVDSIEQWHQLVDQTQQDILKNRIENWNQSYGKTLQSLQSANSQLAEAESAWKELQK